MWPRIDGTGIQYPSCNQICMLNVTQIYSAWFGAEDTHDATVTVFNFSMKMQT